MSLRYLVGGCAAALLLSGSLLYGQAAYKIGSKSTSVSQVYQENQGEFYKLEKQKYSLIERIAHEEYLASFWQKLAKKKGISAAAAEKQYLASKAKVSAKDLKETLDKFKDHPELKKLPKAEQEKQVREYLSSRKKQELVGDIIAKGLASKQLKVLYPEPKEPVFKLTVTKDDHVRFGPSPDDIKPIACKANDCPITIVEYSEFQCPYCARVMPAVKKILAEYKGKIRWVMRDFPLSFHKRATPAAVAAHCAGKQGKFWNMYGKLFENQTKLSDSDFDKYASAIKGLDKKKWTTCVKSPGAINAKIKENIDTGAKLGVSGTPAFFINGRRLSGALPYSEFKRVIDDEMSSKKKKS